MERRDNMMQRSFTAKKSMKGEDFSLSEPEAMWPRGAKGARGIVFGCYAIFDGHGGQVRTFQYLIISLSFRLHGKPEPDPSVVPRRLCMFWYIRMNE